MDSARVSSDASSGYESAEVSDTASVTSIECDMPSTSSNSVQKVTRNHGKQETVCFKSTHALCDNLRLILSMPELCDVMFVVGVNEVPVHGVRAILGTRSRMFYQLILKHIRKAEEERNTTSRKNANTVGVSGSLTSKLIIPVRKYDPEVFRMLIQFVHCGMANIDMDNVVGLLCGAAQFNLDDLADACWEFIHSSLITGNGESLLHGTRSYSQHRITQDIVSTIYESIDAMSSTV